MPITTCTAADLALTTVTDKSAYADGGAVTVTSTIRDVVACDFAPVAAGAYGCPATITMVDGSGNQVWPATGQGEQCSALKSETMQPGATRR